MGLTKVTDNILSQQKSNPNLVVDGNFDHWLEGTSQTTNGYGSDTMWTNNHSGSTKTHSRQSFAPGETDTFDAQANYYSRTVVSSVAGASNNANKCFNLESVSKIAGRTVTLSFRAKADAAKNIAIEFYQYFGSGGSPSGLVATIGAQLVALTTEWKKYTITVSMPSIAGKTLGTDGNDYTGLMFWFDAGSSFASRTANLGQQSGTFDIAQVKLELGSVATPFVAPDPQQELVRVSRFYQYIDPFAQSSNITGENVFWYGFPELMRAAPTSLIKTTECGSTISAASLSLSRKGGIRITFQAGVVHDWMSMSFSLDARL